MTSTQPSFAQRPSLLHRRFLPILFTVVLSTSGCASRRWSLFPTAHSLPPTMSAPKHKGEGRPAPTGPVEASAPPVPAVASLPEATPVIEVSITRETPKAEEALVTVAETESEADEEAGEDDGEEGEEHAVAANAAEGPQYTGDLSDETLAELFTREPEKLGSVSLGFVDAGRLLNGRMFPQGEHWTVVQPDKAWATEETIDSLTRAISRVRTIHPDAPLIRVNQISNREGGWMRPHKSHQNGRDVDLGFYYPTQEPIRVREREKYIDVEKNWALVKALITETDVQFILVDKRIIQVLYAHALKAGEDPAWLESIFKPGPDSLVRHARRHRDHFHVRFYNPRAQELGRRVAPLLAKRPETNVAYHRIRSGDSLSRIAVKYGSSVRAIRTANRLKSDFVRVGVVLSVPLRKPCTQCPIPPPVNVPARRLPPDDKSMAAST